MENKAAVFTLEEANRIVTDAGFESMGGFEDERMIIASSVKTIPGTYGHPAFTVQFMKCTGWLMVGDKRAVKLPAVAQ